MSILTRLVAGLVAIVLVAGLVPGRALAQGSKLTLSTGRDICLSTHISVARAKGYTKAEGLPEIDLKTFPSGIMSLEAVVARDAPIAFTALGPTAILGNNAAPIVLLSQLVDNGGNNILLVRSDANVQKPEDLYKVKIATAVGGGGSVLLYEMARHWKLDESKVQLVNLQPPDQMAAYRSGQVDGLAVWEPWAGRAAKIKPTTILLNNHESFFPGARGKVDLGQNPCVVAAHQDYVRANRDTVNALMRALARAQDYIADRKNAEEVLRIASRDLKQEPADNKEAFERIIFKLVIDESLVSTAQRLTGFLQRSGKIRAAVHPTEWIYSEPLKRARSAWAPVEGRWKP